MQIRTLNGQFSVSSQIDAGDIAEIVRLGFRSLICNRPDGEEADQPSFAEIEAAATAAGIEARYIPVSAGSMHDAHAEAFGRTLLELPGPVLAYCRTGTRSSVLWSMLGSGEKVSG